MSGPQRIKTPEPPVPFRPEEFTLAAGSVVYRVFSNSLHAANPVTVLYCAQTETAAVCETLLRNVPAKGGTLAAAQYRNEVMAGLTTTKDLRLASFMGTGLRRLGVEANQLTDTPGRNYRKTRAWAQAAHREGFEGIAWMSHRNNCDHAYVLFDDRQDGLDVLPASGKIFASGEGRDWLIDLCAPLKIDVLLS